jgi:hypothetical protein
MSRLLLLGLALLVSSSALAQQPYRRTVVPGKPLCLAWNQREYLYHYDSAGSIRTPGDSEFAAMEAAFDTWRTLAASCTDYTFTRGANMSAPRVGYVEASEGNPEPVNENVILFREASCVDVLPDDAPCYDSKTCGNDHGCWDHGDGIIGLTTSTYSTRTGHVLDADIELNASQPGGSGGFLFTTVSSPPCEGTPSTSCVAVDLQNTMTHEIGHVMGLDHVLTPGSTMEATAPPGETHKRIIDVGSAEGVCTMYPRGLPPTQCLEPVEKGHELTADSRLGCAAAPASLLPAGLLFAWALRSRRRRSRG